MDPVLLTVASQLGSGEAVLGEGEEGRSGRRGRRLSFRRVGTGGGQRRTMHSSAYLLANLPGSKQRRRQLSLLLQRLIFFSLSCFPLTCRALLLCCSPSLNHLGCWSPPLPPSSVARLAQLLPPLLFPSRVLLSPSSDRSVVSSRWRGRSKRSAERSSGRTRSQSHDRRSVGRGTRRTTRIWERTR
jgi:hypothetical protein